MLLLTSCLESQRYFDRTFTGMWAGTSWTYEFHADGSFVMKAAGHYGFAEYPGTYAIDRGIIFLNPASDWQLFDGVLKGRLKLASESCIRDYDNNYYCIDIKTASKKSEEEFEFQETSRAVLDTLSLTRAVRKKYLYNHADSSERHSEPKIYYDGIVVVKQKELHLFILQSYDLKKDKIMTYESYLVGKRPFEIYRHITQRDSLIQLYPL